MLTVSRNGFSRNASALYANNRYLKRLRRVQTSRLNEYQVDTMRLKLMSIFGIETFGLS
jgi:hypothetical protein